MSKVKVPGTTSHFLSYLSKPLKDKQTSPSVWNWNVLQNDSYQINKCFSVAIIPYWVEVVLCSFNLISSRKHAQMKRSDFNTLGEGTAACTEHPAKGTGIIVRWLSSNLCQFTISTTINFISPLHSWKINPAWQPSCISSICSFHSICHWRTQNTYNPFPV